MSGHPHYPKLAYRFGAFFHQDWDAEGDAWPDLVRNDARGTLAAELLATAAEIVALASAGDTDEECGRVLAGVVWKLTEGLRPLPDPGRQEAEPDVAPDRRPAPW